MDFDLYIRDSLVEQIDHMVDRYHTFLGSRVKENSTDKLGTIVGKGRYEEIIKKEHGFPDYELDVTKDVLIEFDDGTFARTPPSKFINRYSFVSDSIRNNLVNLCRVTDDAVIDSVLERAKAVEKIKNRD